jgi:hypothetical protein
MTFPRRFTPLVLALSVAIPSGAPAQDVPLVPLVPPSLGEREDAATLDLNGVWEYATSNHQGGCPGSHAGFPMAGIMQITQAGAAIAMELVSGATCDPASLCGFAGEIAEGDLILWNTATVDDEGGKVTNTLQISFISPEIGQGIGGALYAHPRMQCGWSWDIFLHRPEIDEGGDWQPGAAQGAD